MPSQPRRWEPAGLPASAGKREGQRRPSEEKPEAAHGRHPRQAAVARQHQQVQGAREEHHAAEEEHRGQPAPTRAGRKSERDEHRAVHQVVQTRRAPGGQRLGADPGFQGMRAEGTQGNGEQPADARRDAERPIAPRRGPGAQARRLPPRARPSVPPSSRSQVPGSGIGATLTWSR